MDKLLYERADYSVVVKNRAPPPKAWRWEIYRAGNANPIKQSSSYFDTTAAARRAEKDAQTRREVILKTPSRLAISHRAFDDVHRFYRRVRNRRGTARSVGLFASVLLVALG
jgi:hypothetical protein